MIDVFDFYRNYTFTVITISGDEQNLRRQSTTFSANYTTEVIFFFTSFILVINQTKQNKMF